MNWLWLCHFIPEFSWHNHRIFSLLQSQVTKLPSPSEIVSIFFYEKLIFYLKDSPISNYKTMLEFIIYKKQLITSLGSAKIRIIEIKTIEIPFSEKEFYEAVHDICFKPGTHVAMTENHLRVVCQTLKSPLAFYLRTMWWFCLQNMDCFCHVNLVWTKFTQFLHYT